LLDFVLEFLTEFGWFARLFKIAPELNKLFALLRFKGLLEEYISLFDKAGFWFILIVGFELDLAKFLLNLFSSNA